MRTSLRPLDFPIPIRYSLFAIPWYTRNDLVDLSI